MTLTLKTLANSIHYTSLYIDSDAPGSVEVSLDGRSFNTISVIGGRSGGWLRYGVEVPAAQASGSTTLYLRVTAAGNYYIDSADVEENNYPTTYIDGDQPGCKWSGLRHGSASTRSAQERSGGRERNLLDDYGIEVVEGTKRIGTPPIMHNLLGMSLLPGALHQGTKVLPREIELHLNYSAESWSDFHGKRSEVFALFDPNLTSGAQPIVIGYAGKGTNNKLYSSFYYNGGLEFGDFLSYDEVAPVRLLAPDPFWYADDQQTASLDYQDSLTTTNRAHRRYNGQWAIFGSGFGTTGPTSVKCDKKRGIIYVAGTYTTVNGAGANRICYWDGNSFYPMRTGTNDTIHDIAIAPNGDVWAVGTFTSVDGQTTNDIAKWDYNTQTWTAYNLSGTGTWFALAISKTGIVYVGGSNVNWNGDANQDYITQYDGSSWSAVGTSPFSSDDYPACMTIDKNDDLIVGTTSVSAAATVRKWDGSAWTTLATTNSGGASVLSVFESRTGDIYIGGTFSTIGGVTVSSIAKYNGTSIVDFCGGLSAGVYDIKETSRGELLISGSYSAYGGLAIADGILYWNGSTFASLDIDFPGTPAVYQCELVGDDIYVISSASGVATVSGITTVTNGGTANVFPRLTVINGNTSGTCLVQWLENQSTDHRMYYNLTVQAGETVTLDLANSQKKLTSDWRGVITDNPLKNSDVVNWHLLRGANTVATFITGTVTSVVALLHWVPRYWSADGSA